MATKGGYITPTTTDVNKVYQNVITLSEGLAYSLSPSFLEDQITLSLERLQMDTIDLYMLHNPEHLFSTTTVIIYLCLSLFHMFG